MGASFNIGNQTIGGGTAFANILADMTRLLSEDTRGRADVGLGLFSGLLESELQSSRRPVSIVDQLLLQQRFGTQSPLSQLSGGEIREFGIPQENPFLDQLRDSIGNFATGRDERFEQAYESFSRDFTFTDRSDPGGRFRAATRFVNLVGQQHVPEIARRVREAGHDELARALLTKFPGDDQPAQLQAGGSFTVKPGKKRTSGSTAAGPVRMVDATGRTVAVAGEGSGDETIQVIPNGARAATPSTGGGVPGPGTPGTTITPQELPPNLAREIRFRVEAIMERSPLIGIEGAIELATQPGAFERFFGRESNPRAQAAVGLGAGLSADLRFTDPFVRALALGRSPTTAELTAGDVTTLSPFNRDILASVVGEDLFPQFLFELGLFSPRGTQVRQGTVAGLRV